jgi:hypothetical protein
MKKNNLTLIVILVAGLLTGSIFAQLFADVPGLSFLTKSADIRWEPSADLQVIRYDIRFAVTLNLASVIGLAAAVWIYRKM